MIIFFNAEIVCSISDYENKIEIYQIETGQK